MVCRRGSTACRSPMRAPARSCAAARKGDLSMNADASVADILTATKIISSDSHIVEPPDLWSRQSSALGDRMPHVVTEGDGDWWYVDGKKTMSFLGIQTGDRFERDSH